MRVCIVATISVAVMFMALCFAPAISAEEDDVHYSWSMDGGDARHSGVSPYFINEMPEDVLWDRSIDGEPTWPLATGPDGMIFVAIGTEVDALNHDGQWIWSYDAEGTVASQIAVDGNGSACFLVVAEGSNALSLVMIDHEGNEIWSKGLTYEVAVESGFVTRNVHYASSPVIGADGKIYFTSLASTTQYGEENVYIFNELTYEGSTVFLTNHQAADPYTNRDIVDPAVFDNGTVLFASSSTVYAMGPDGGYIWEFSLPAGGKISDLTIGENGESYFLFEDMVYCIDDSGVLLWSCGSFIDGSSILAVTSFGAYVQEYSENELSSIVLISNAGAKQWTYDVDLNATDEGTSVVDSTGLIIICGSDAVVGLYPNGTEAWSSDVMVQDDEETFTSPVIGDNDTVYMITFDLDNGVFSVYAIGNWLDKAVYNFVLLFCLAFAPFFIAAGCYLYFKEDEK